MTMNDEKSGTAIVTPDKHKAYMSPMFPKKIHTPEAMAKPIRGALSCSSRQSARAYLQASSSACYSAASNVGECNICMSAYADQSAYMSQSQLLYELLVWVWFACK